MRFPIVWALSITPVTIDCTVDSPYFYPYVSVVLRLSGRRQVLISSQLCTTYYFYKIQECHNTIKLLQMLILTLCIMNQSSNNLWSIDETWISTLLYLNLNYVIYFCYDLDNFQICFSVFLTLHIISFNPFNDFFHLQNLCLVLFSFLPFLLWWPGF